MRQLQFIISVTLLFGLGLTESQAQIKFVKEKNGTQTAYSFSSIKKMSFSNGYLTVSKMDNSSGIYALSGLRYLNFIDLTTSLLDEPYNHVQVHSLTAYPNPVRNVLSIDLNNSDFRIGTLNIFNFEGKIVLTQQVSQSGLFTLDMSHLANGIYIIQYLTATDHKIVKIVKQ